MLCVANANTTGFQTFVLEAAMREAVKPLRLCPTPSRRENNEVVVDGTEHNGAQHRKPHQPYLPPTYPYLSARHHRQFSQPSHSNSPLSPLPRQIQILVPSCRKHECGSGTILPSYDWLNYDPRGQDPKIELQWQHSTASWLSK